MKHHYPVLEASKGIAERPLYLVFFKTTGLPYKCLGSVSMLPNVDETVDSMTKRTMMQVHDLSQYEVYKAYQVRGH